MNISTEGNGMNLHLFRLSQTLSAAWAAAGDGERRAERGRGHKLATVVVDSPIHTSVPVGRSVCLGLVYERSVGRSGCLGSEDRARTWVLFSVSRMHVRRIPSSTKKASNPGIQIHRFELEHDNFETQ